MFIKCRKCKEYKDESKYYKEKSNLSGVYGNCKDCIKKYNIIYPYPKKKQIINPLYLKNYHLQYKFNITLDDYTKLYDERNGKCDICKKYFKTLFIDHNHKTNAIRGIICRNCNVALGLFHDKVECLEKALIYLGY